MVNIKIMVQQPGIEPGLAAFFIKKEIFYRKYMEGCNPTIRLLLHN